MGEKRKIKFLEKNFIDMINNVTTIYDVLKALVQYGLPIVGVVVGIFLGKWIEKRHENDKLKREIYLVVKEFQY